MSVRLTAVSNQCINFGTVAGVQHVTNKTIVMWLKLNSYCAQSSDMRILGGLFATAAGSEQWYLEQHGTAGIVELLVAVNSGNMGQWKINSGLSLNTLYCIATTYNNSATTNNPVFYLNGSLAASTRLLQPSTTAPAGNTNVVAIGAAGIPAATDPAGDAWVQDCRIYNRALSASEIAALAAAGRTIEMNDSGLVFHAPLMYATGIGDGLPFGATLTGTTHLYDRIVGAQGTPASDGDFPQGYSDLVYGTSF